MDRRVSRTIRLKSLLIATLVGILLGGVLYLVERPYYRLLATQERDRVQVWSARLGAALGTSVSRRLALLAGLKAHVVSIAIKDGNAEALNSSFEGFATGLYHSTPGVRNFIVAPAGVNKYVYPLERNKKALGHNIMADQRPTVRRDVQRTVETRMPALSGPYELRQGGLGLVVRDAVYLGDALWGLVSMVIDMPPVLEEAGVLEIPEGLVLGLHDVRGKLFYGSPEVFSLSPVLVKVLLPEGAWELGVVPKRGWGVSFDFAIAIFRGLALAIVLLAGTSAYLLSNRQQHLTLAVVERTDELSTLNADLKLENTRRRETEALMSRQQEYIQDIIDSMPSMIVGVTADGVIKLWNLRAADELGIMARDAVNSQLKDVAPGIVEYMSMVGRALETGEVQRDLRRHRLDAEEGLIEDVTVYPLGSERHEVVIRIDDVTERVGIEQRMIQTERMVSLGGLAAGMAHEINNPLGGVLQSVQNIQRRLDPALSANAQALKNHKLDAQAMQGYLKERKIDFMLEGIKVSGERAARVVGNMLSFSNRQGMERTTCKLDEVADDALALASTDYDLTRSYDFKTIQIIRDYQKEMPMVLCVRSDIEQVVLNLVMNAAQAIGSTIRDVAAPRIVVRLRHDDDHALLEVEDNGPGMTALNMHRVFEPFFTTKEPGEGTGLGLSVSYFIVTKNHGGTMSVRSKLGEGTCFSVQLPVGGGVKE